MGMLCSTSFSTPYDAFELFSSDFDYKLCENGEPLKMRWFDDKFKFLMKF